MQATAVREGSAPAAPASQDAGTAGSIAETPEWKALEAHALAVDRVHLRELLQDAERSAALSMEADGVYADFSRQRVTAHTVSVRATH